MVRPRRSASTVSEGGDSKQDPPLRRSTREREQAQQSQATPVASSASPRSRKKGRGLPMGSSRARGAGPVPASAGESPEFTNSPIVSAGTVSSKGNPGMKSLKASRKVRMSPPPQVGAPLTALHKNGTTLCVHLIVNGKTFQPAKFRKGSADAADSGPPEKRPGKQLVRNFLGQDGNLYYCVVCGGFGDVVCCDGCPHVYHPECVPLGSASRESLENDDDPWFCPECMGKKSPANIEGRPEGRNKRAIKHSCQECQQTRSDLSLCPCKVCGVYIHHPPCVRATTPSEFESSSVIMCSSCRAEAALTEEELERHAKKKRKLSKNEGEDPPASHEASPTKEEDRDEPERGSGIRPVDEEEGAVEACKEKKANDIGEDNGTGAGQKRKRPPSVTSPGDPISPTKKRKKKKKKKKLDLDEGLAEEATSPDASGSALPMESPASLPGIPRGHMPGPPTSATPAFHFYLAEMRPKVEKVLMKKDKSFSRLPKGNKRNALIAKEAATWWIKLSPIDQKKYIDLSMRDYEARIIAWKEEKNLRAMLAGEAEAESAVAEAETGEKAQDEDMLRYEMHKRLYLGTSVGSKPFKPESGESHNRVLLDLLRDMRFHPLPMFSVTRNEADIIPTDASKACVPYFDVHGPISTSVGDECFGCTRGWPHFCPVLQRRMPAVEPRAKLQPPLSSLVASRIGIGLRPRLEHTEIVKDEDEDENEVELLKWRESKEAADMQNQRFVPSGTLTDPSSRADDIVQFLEEVVAMKIPEPPRPEPPGKQDATPKKSVLARGVLPTRQKRPDGASPDAAAEGGNTGYEHINKCGRCRTIIMTDLGCTQCRRAQLVINMSKQLPAVSADHKGEKKKEPKKDPKTESKKEAEEQGGPLKVQTAMLGRVVTKDIIGEAQSEGDKRVSAAILRERWAPFAVLPPQKMLAPSPSRRSTKKPEAQDEEDAVSSQDKAPPEVVTSEVQAAVTRERGGTKGFHPVKADPNTDLRPRNARRVAAPGAFETDDAERQLAARQYREEADKLHKRTLSISCCGILLGLMRRDPLLLFAQPVTAEGYAAIIKDPMDFSKIRTKVLSESYQSLGAFAADVKLLCQNALIFNPPGSIYWKTAKELSDVLAVMQKRANKWISAIKNTHASFWRKTALKKKLETDNNVSETAKDYMDLSEGDPFEKLRQTWPDAVDMYENSEWLKDLLMADFTRTRENETAFYGCLAVRRAAVAAEECLAPYTDVGGALSVVVKRTHVQDEKLRQMIDGKVAKIIEPVQLKEIATAREEAIVRLMRKVQSRRLERRIGSENGCARCDGMGLDHDMKVVMNAEKRWGRSKKKGEGEANRVAQSRLGLTTGLASANTLERIEKRREQSSEEQCNTISDVCVSLRGSRIHGWGLFAEQPFKKGDIVAEYVGECVSLPVADAREKMYQEMRIQDYQFRLDDSQIIDATMKGGLGRYINHNCNPNCRTKIVKGTPPNQHLRRVLIIAQRDIEPREELSYDYQFPLELDLNARIPCNCQSEICRGFMNWDLPEKGANTGALRTQKRGANMRDRIRRLGRPLKK